MRLLLGTLLLALSLAAAAHQHQGGGGNPNGQASAVQGPVVAVQDGDTKWSYSERPDKMRGATTTFASVRSNNVASFNFPYQGGSPMLLALRKSARSGSDVILTIAPGQFVCVLECSVHVKFDAGKVETFGASGPSDGSAKAVFIDSYDRFVGKLKKAKKVMVEADFYQEGATQFEFDVAGLVWR
jgi:hypothetical protein